MTHQLPDDTEKAIDTIMEDLIVGHNFEYAGKALKELFAAHTAKAVEVNCKEHMSKLEAEERAHENTIEQRDNAEGWADKLAYAKYGIEQIGEHSSANNPWHNAVELLEAEAQLTGGHNEE